MADTQQMLGKKRWMVMSLVVALATLGFSPAANADSASENTFLSLINATRAANGLGPLTVDGSLRSHARNHTGDMIAAGNIYHSSSAELRAAAGSGWTKVGENVGRGQSPSSLHTAFMDSSGHRANILGDYNFVGIGTGSTGGYLYVTVVFMKKGSTQPPTPTTTTTTTTATTTSTSGGNPTTTAGSAPTTSQATTTTAPQPTTTTLPPTTTTTMDVGPDKAVTPGQSCLSSGLFGQICHE